MPRPKVSILMPVYNGLPFLPEAVESILGQTFQDFELIIVDDGSRDGSREILDRYAAADPRVVLLHREHAGLIAALNEACRHATGDYLARMDADDVSYPRRLECQLAALEARPDVAVISCAADLLDASGKVLGLWAPQFGDDMLLELAARNPIVHGSVMMRRRDFELAGGYGAPPEDYDLWIRLARQGKSFAVAAGKAAERQDNQTARREGGAEAPGTGGVTLYGFRAHPERYSLTHKRGQSEGILRVQLPLLESCTSRHWGRNPLRPRRLARVSHDDTAAQGTAPHAPSPRAIARLMEGWGRVGSAALVCRRERRARRCLRWVFGLAESAGRLYPRPHPEIVEAFHTAADTLVWAKPRFHQALRLRLAQCTASPLDPARWRDLLLCIPIRRDSREGA